MNLKEPNVAGGFYTGWCSSNLLKMGEEVRSEGAGAHKKLKKLILAVSFYQVFPRLRSEL